MSDGHGRTTNGGGGVGGASSPATASRSRWELWLLAASPAIWSVHFMASYLTAAIWCAKAGQSAEVSLRPVRVAIAVYTAAALLAIAAVGLVGRRRHRLGGAALPHDADTPEDRHRFLGFATVLLSALSAVATVYSALAAVFVRSCQ
jgi:hypothetical protein